MQYAMLDLTINIEIHSCVRVSRVRKWSRSDSTSVGCVCSHFLRIIIWSVQFSYQILEFDFPVLTSTISEFQAVNKEVKKGSQTTISCIITGLSAATASVSWRTSTGAVVSGDNFTPSVGTQADGNQTSTLLVKGAQVSADTAYTCRVTSGSLPDSGSSNTTVNLNVYGRL